jgi:hypothetical protein
MNPKITVQAEMSSILVFYMINISVLTKNNIFDKADSDLRGGSRRST